MPLEARAGGGDVSISTRNVDESEMVLREVLLEFGENLPKRPVNRLDGVLL
jgi:hypothetical protein